VTLKPPSLDTGSLLVQQERADRRRFEALTGWLRSLGVCGLCAVGMALTIVEHEGMRPPVERGPCRRDWGRARSCEARARDAWAERPRRAG